MERCLNCQYYDRNQRGAEAKAGSAGQCRRSGPALSPLNQKTYMIEGVWPTVRDDDWCGEWKALQRRVEPSRIGELFSTPLSTPVPATAAFTAPLPRVSAQVPRPTLQVCGSEVCGSESERHPTAPPAPIAALPFSIVGKSSID